MSNNTDKDFVREAKRGEILNYNILIQKERTYGKKINYDSCQPVSCSGNSIGTDFGQGFRNLCRGWRTCSWSVH